MGNRITIGYYNTCIVILVSRAERATTCMRDTFDTPRVVNPVQNKAYLMQKIHLMQLMHAIG